MVRRTGEIKFRRIALLIQYNGLAFHGWQIQNNQISVQSEITNALLILTGENVNLIASGRTDAGVHALGQVAHFDLTCDISLIKLCNGLNGILKNDIAILNAYAVSNDFHARYSACEREYLYIIYNYLYKSPFVNQRAMWIKNPLNIDYLQEICNNIIGEYDFSSFCKKKSADINTIRKINQIIIKKSDNYIYLTIKGNAFLHNMIRIMIGTIIEISKNNKDPEFILEIISKKDRDFSGPTAAPYGLYLKEITYKPDLSTYPSAL